MKKTTTYGIRNPGSVLGQVRKCGEVKPVKMIPNTRFINTWSFNVILILFEDILQR